MNSRASIIETIAPLDDERFDAATLTQVRLSPNERELAIAVGNGPHAGVFVQNRDTQEVIKLVGYPGFSTPRLAWSSGGDYLAYQVRSDPPGYGDQVGYLRKGERGEVNRVDGQCFAWSARGSLLYVLNAATASLVRHDIEAGGSRSVSEFSHHTSPEINPALVPSADGQRLAFTSRNELEDTSRVFVVGREQGIVCCKLITWIPGRDMVVRPFWSPKGVSLGLWMAHEALQKTGLVLVKGVEGDGEVFYESDSFAGHAAPAWAPDGRSLLVFINGAPRCLSLRTRELCDLCPDLPDVPLSGGFMPPKGDLGPRVLLEGPTGATIVRYQPSFQ